MVKPFVAIGAALLAACSPAPSQGADAGRNSSAPATNLAADATADEPALPRPEQSDVTILVRSDGLLAEWPGHAAPLNFEQTNEAQAMKALEALGPPRRSSNAECPAGPLDFMDWDNGLQLIFQDGKLAGWWASDKARGLATASGLRPGSPRSAIRAARVEDTTVGKVFTLDGVNGVLDEASGTKVDALWAGTACIFH